MRTGLGVTRVHVELVAKLDVIAPAAKVAEQRLSDSDAIAVVTIFHRDFYRRDWRWSSLARSHTGDQKPSRVMESNVENQNPLSVRPEVAVRRDRIRRSLFAITSTRNWVLPNRFAKLPETAYRR